MTAAPPAKPKIYHILHVDRLASVVANKRLYSDAAIRARAGAGTVIGMQGIKDRRLTLPVTCHPKTYVGDYVPFYFCARSIMLYLLYMGNAPGLDYRGGQVPIVTLEADLHTVVERADKVGRRWAFSLGNAGANYQSFRKDLSKLSDINWTAVQATDFRSSDVKEGKQAEFLVHESFPWPLVERIGVRNVDMQKRVKEILDGADHTPPVQVRTDWYY
jgi:hypothetical protein